MINPRRLVAVFAAALTVLAIPSPAAAVGTATSGVYTTPPDAATASGFGSWRGTPVSVWHAFDSASWSSIESPPRTPFLTLGMLPKNDTTADLPKCASGLFDAHYRAAAAHLVSIGRGDADVRIGHEYNRSSSRDWSINPDGPRSHGVDQTANFVKCYQRMVTAMRSVGGQAFRFVFSPGVGTQSSYPDPALAWPGDGYVSVLAMDQYDKWYGHGGAAPADRWTQLRTFNGRGIDYWRDFAGAHGKPFGFAEWGLWGAGDAQGGGGDDPYYINQVADYLAAVRTAGNSTVELYFDVSASDGDHKIWPTTAFPSGAAAYKTRF